MTWPWPAAVPRPPAAGTPPRGSPVDGGNQGRKRSPITKARGHFALTGLLLEQMLPLPGSRVVTVSSLAHRLGARINFDDLQGERSYRRVAAYSQSKLANLLFTYELQRRLSGAGTTIAVAAHPGLANTELTRNTPAITAFFYARVMSQQAAMGALPILRAATDPGVLGGQYYGPGGPFGARGYPKLAESSALSHNTAIQRRLWTVSEGHCCVGCDRGRAARLLA
jgi:NAD(P)-dependent dehydrogenase (short-subunit alcohol dehydrogenase family)